MDMDNIFKPKDIILTDKYQIQRMKFREFIKKQINKALSEQPWDPSWRQIAFTIKPFQFRSPRVHSIEEAKQCVNSVIEQYKEYWDVSYCGWSYRYDDSLGKYRIHFTFEIPEE